MKFLKNTLSLCPECFKVIKATVFMRDNVVYMQKRCSIHGEFCSRHVWDSEKVYREMVAMNREFPQLANGLVLNLTNKCNINCPFCFSRSDELEIPELKTEKIESILSEYNGEIVYLSGGEPTVRPDLISLIKLIKIKGFKVGLFTNGKKLSKEFYVRRVKKAGVDFVILQFDSLNDKNYEIIRGEKLKEVKEKVVENLSYYNIPVYLFVMLVGGVNSDEIKDLLKFVSKNKNSIKIINFNPVWEIGRIDEHKLFTSSMILEKFEEQTSVTEKELLVSTKFLFYLFDVLQRLKFKKLNIHPRCELRCYVIFDHKVVVPITRMINLERINFVLDKIIPREESKIMLFVFTFIGFFQIVPELIVSFTKNNYFRTVVGKFLKNIFKKIFSFQNRLSFLSISPFVSIIIGTFQTAYNVDFDLTKTCNLYSNIPGSKETFSACVREMLMDSVSNMEEYKEKKLAEKFNNIKDWVFEKAME